MTTGSQSNEAAGGDTGKVLEAAVIKAMRGVFDPEVPVNIYDLGLIYDCRISPTGDVDIRMTLTTPACPVAGSLPGEVERRVKSVGGVTGVKVELVWDPPWTRDMMSSAAKLQLGMDMDMDTDMDPGGERLYNIRPKR